MKQPKVIRFRCYCFECSGDNEETSDRSRSDTVEADRDSAKSSEHNLRLIPDMIGKLLFGA